MASLTKKTRKIRKRKKASAGTERKRKLRSDGSTPKFAIHEAPASGASKS
jgi:hypothetical protein